MSTAAKNARQIAAQARGEAIGRGMNAMGETLTGYEEIGIVKAFGYSWSSEDLDTSMTMRALVFALKKRDGLTHDEAYDAVMQMTSKEVMDIAVSHDADEPMPDEPVTEMGKDDSQPGNEPMP